MELTLERRYKCNGYTIGRLLIDGRYFCDTLEDADRGLDSNMPLEEIKRRKLKSITAIPTGRYRITLSVKSPKFGNKQFYHNVCRGKLPRLLDVKGFEGVLIHCGNYAGYETFFKKIPVDKNKQLLSTQEYIDVV